MARFIYTSRDIHYLRAAFYLGGGEIPVSPSQAALLLNVSTVSAYQKLRRLEALGLGNYLPQKGLLVNAHGIAIVEEEIRKHHLIERFLQLRLGMDSKRSCGESDRLSRGVSDVLLAAITDDVGNEVKCDCGCCIDPPYDTEDLRKCHWFVSLFEHGTHAPHREASR